MLILGRDVNDAIIIEAPNGDKIRLCVTGMSGQGHARRVRIGISAPRNYVISRTEIAPALCDPCVVCGKRQGIYNDSASNGLPAVCAACLMPPAEAEAIREKRKVDKAKT